MVECSPATRAARVRFPASARFAPTPFPIAKGNPTDLIKNGEDSWVAFKQVDTLSIVAVSNFRPRQSLICIFILDLFKEMLDKMLLELLICIIYAELFQTVVRKTLESVNVQDSCITSNIQPLSSDKK